MKNFLISTFVILIASTTLKSCTGSGPESIKISNMRTVCDFLDGAQKCTEAMLKIADNKAYNKLSNEDQKKIDEWKSKIYDIGAALEKKYTRAEAKECTNFSKIEDNLNKLNELHISIK